MPKLILPFYPVTNDLHVKFESDLAKTVVYIVSTRQSMTDARMHSLTHPHTNDRTTISPPTLLRGDKKSLAGNITVHTLERHQLSDILIIAVRWGDS